MEITLAFNKNIETYTDRLISKWTKSPYVHVEMIIGDKWISSSTLYGGVKVQKLRPLKDHWDYVVVNVQEIYTEDVWEFIIAQEGKDYDWAGIIWAQVFNIKRGQNQDKWFCSELVAEILRRFGNPKIKKCSASYNPGELFDIYGWYKIK